MEKATETLRGERRVHSAVGADAGPTAPPAFSCEEIEAGPCAPSAPAAPPEEGRRRAILVVDDDRAVNRVITRFLIRRGYAVDSAFDGLEALRVLRPSEHSVVISDIVMPHMNGWDFVAALRADAPLTPVVLMSGYDETDDVALNKGFLSERGVVAVLCKPFDMQTLGRILEDATRGTVPAAR
jgi:CheY-like chemotaxis protein